MKVVALISGGKDSCFNLMHCVGMGHDVVAVANLNPIGKDELDSFMYQTVGHECIGLISQALNLPLFRRAIQGQSVQQEAAYHKTEGDEVEDLFELLQDVKIAHPEVLGVSVGAILSDYQRVRVESVCARLNLTSIAYLWQRDQKELLAEIIASDVHAVLIKVAAIGLKPSHLGKSLAEMSPILLKLNELYDVHPCGEGGEYESLVLDCPLFERRIVLDETRIVSHSNDAFAPVAYLKVHSAHLEEKHPVLTFSDRVHQLRRDFRDSIRNKWILGAIDNLSIPASPSCSSRVVASSQPPLCCPVHIRHANGFVFITGFSPRIAKGQDKQEYLENTVTSFSDLLKANGILHKNVISVSLFLQDMSLFLVVNAAYSKVFRINPPSRACVQVPLGDEQSVLIEAIARIQDEKADTRFLHVQSISHWAPSNIGPYSQAVQYHSLIFVSGQIGLYPSTMLLANGLFTQSELALVNSNNVLSVFRSDLTQAVLALCFVIDISSAEQIEAQFKEICGSSCEVLFVEVPALPRGAMVEWQFLIQLPKSEIEPVHHFRIVHHQGTDFGEFWSKFDADGLLIRLYIDMTQVQVDEVLSACPPSLETLLSIIPVTGLRFQSSISAVIWSHTPASRPNCESDDE